MTSFLSMATSLGRPNCFHSAMNFPFESKIWTRLLPRSATKIRPWESIAIPCSWSNSPCPLPCLPQVKICLPVLSNLTTRSLVFPPWPSPTKMSPLDATTTLLAPLKKPSALPGMPWWPSVISTWPSGLNLTTTPPLPFRIPLSAAQIIAFIVDIEAMRLDEHIGAEAPHELAGRIELLDRVAAVRGTAVEHPDALAVAMVDLDLDGPAELAALRELQPVVLHLVRIWRRIGIGGLGIAAVAGDGPRADSDADHQCHSHNVFHRAPPLRN